MLASQLGRPLAWLALATTIVAANTSKIATPTSDAGSSSTATATTSSSTGITTHTIQVGPKSNPHQFDPSEIKANVGDIVVFEFYPTNHSVVQAEYDAPCIPASGDIFYSGPFANFNLQGGQIVGPPPTWSLRVNNTEPTFFYCTAIDSCTKNGMVGVINPNTTQSWETQYAKALKYPYMLVPGQPIPPEGDGGGDSSSGNDSSSGDDKSNHDKHGLSTGAIAGIAVAAVAFVAILVALFFVLGRNRVYSQWMSSEDGRTERTARWALFNHGDNGKSEVGSAVPTHKSGPVDMTSVSSPDPTVRAMSPEVGVYSGPASPLAQQGHWSWNEPIPRTRESAIATELEGHPIIWEAPGSTPHDRV
ncbi:Cupredoxin [Penicillium robsamsonii]|uniref:Cupredoxin n=1 Tax=Penicillium robsamsonii TaxID=1792511 RepID=UPI002546E89D|nr:Cupredoxin [Penicillium robsamsonii]KAJ5824910.1 Cupredoxin [Penicillium robsamsonii]